MAMNEVAGVVTFLAVPFDTLGNVSKQKGLQKTYDVVDVRASRRQVKTAISRIHTYAIVFKLPLLLATLVHITREYLPKLYTNVCVEVLYVGKVVLTLAVLWRKAIF